MLYTTASEEDFGKNEVGWVEIIFSTEKIGHKRSLNAI